MVNTEIELTRTVDIEKKNAVVRSLINAGISYLEKWERVPFFKRREYGGAKEVCVILVNESQKEKAEELLYKVNNGEGPAPAHRYKIKALRDNEEGAEKKDREDDFFDEEDS